MCVVGGPDVASSDEQAATAVASERDEARALKQACEAKKAVALVRAPDVGGRRRRHAS